VILYIKLQSLKVILVVEPKPTYTRFDFGWHCFISKGLLKLKTGPCKNAISEMHSKILRGAKYFKGKINHDVQHLTTNLQSAKQESQNLMPPN